MRLKRFLNQKGHSMMETVITMAIMGVLISVGIWTFQPVLDSWTLGTARSEAINDAKYSLDRMVTEITQIKDSQSITAANANALTFTDINDNSIQYNVSGGNLLRNGDIFARNVNSITFTYWDINNQTLASPQVSPSDTDIWRISIQLDVQADTNVVNVESVVHPRNLSRF